MKKTGTVVLLAITVVFAACNIGWIILISAIPQIAVSSEMEQQTQKFTATIDEISIEQGQGVIVVRIQLQEYPPELWMQTYASKKDDFSNLKRGDTISFQVSRANVPNFNITYARNLPVNVVQVLSLSVENKEIYSFSDLKQFWLAAFLPFYIFFGVFALGCTVGAVFCIRHIKKLERREKMALSYLPR